MNKKISSLFICLTIFVIIGICLMFFLKFNHSTTSYLINNDHQSILIMKTSDFEQLKNQDQVSFDYKQVTFSNEITSYQKNHDEYLLFLDKYYQFETNNLIPVTVVLKATNIFGF